MAWQYRCAVQYPCAAIPAAYRSALDLRAATCGTSSTTYNFQRKGVGWLICCCASTCCAALLCTVLWSRFLEVPALMELWDLQSEETPHQNMPLVVVCPPVDASAALLFFATFEMDETEEPMFIKPGFNHFARLRFTSIPQNSVEELVGIACNPKKDYSKANCLAKCAERACGCTNPLHSKNYFVQNRLPMCTITQLPCLKTHQNKSKCNCLPCCNKVTTYVTLDSELNATSSVLHLRVYISLSRIFTTNPTETWLSLLCKWRASLGGVFNMFLGVGLFSGLEILFLLFVKLPIAFRKSSEITNPPSSRY
ncbi:Uncharacterized protein OBRU01_18330 [Operophtera brumata]|uniref:Uncharacterized protein n=1 Tax=Operophtera brumata TaxID=104452 RepID=A0A0L7KZ11_OPEBR|nr:Uncharacterized protein OBRU01_18330 [Operophtera brumata]